MPVTGGEIIAAGPYFPLVDDGKVRGGYRVVADNIERDALAGTDFAKLGMMVFVQGSGLVYVLTSGGWSLFAGGGGGGGGGWVKIVDVSGQGAGVVSDKTYQDPPYNTILQTAVSDSEAVSVTLKSSYPLIEVAGVPATLPPSSDGGHYEGTVNVTDSGSLIAVNFNGDGDTGALDTISLTIEAGPQILSLSFTGSYPGTQTELKAGDSFQVTGTTDVPADSVKIHDIGAGVDQVIAFALSTSFTVTIVIADRGTSSQALPARVSAGNPAGAYGGTRDTDTGPGFVDGLGVVTLNNLYPTVVFGSVTYPATQTAIKDSEQASVAVSTSDLDTIFFDSPTSELSVTSPTADAPTKVVTRISGGYNVSTDNLRAQATRLANDAVTWDQTLVAIAHDQASITVSEPEVRLVSGGNDGTSPQDHVITVASDQDLAAAPTLVAPAGAWQGAGFAGGPGSWTRGLRVHDDDVKGVYAWGTLNAVNRAGVVTTAITGSNQYEIGGFVARTLVFDSFPSTTVMGVDVVNFSKLQAGIFTATSQAAIKQVVGTPPVVINGWTIDAAGINPTTVIWLDTPAANSNSSGTAAITDVQELP